MSTIKSTSDEYFTTPGLKSLLQQLSHLAFFGDGMSVVQGLEGSGKSALAKELTGHLQQAHDVVTIALSKELELADCVELVSQSLGVGGSESLSLGELLSELRHYVQALMHDQKLVVLIIDDAHHLDDQAIGALVSLLQGRGESNVGLHIILLALPGLDKRIDALQIIDVPVYDFDIPAFSPSELSHFLERDSQLEPSLTSSLIQRIWVSSRGLPGPALGSVYKNNTDEASGRTWFKNGIPIGHFAAIAVLAAALLFTVLWTSDESKDTNASKSAALPLINTPLPQQTSIVSEVEPVATDDTARDFEILSELPQTIDTQPPPSVTPVVEIGATGERKEGNESNLQLDPSLEVLPKIEIVTTPAGAPSISPQVEPAPDDSVSVSATAPLSTLEDAELFIMSQNPEFYTLQVIAASKKGSLEAYVLRQANRESLRMYRGTREGKSWFVVVEGVYSTRAAALDGRNALPKEQADAGPWPRKFSSVQEEIEAYMRR